jgi:hypothetical protein
MSQQTLQQARKINNSDKRLEFIQKNFKHGSNYYSNAIKEWLFSHPQDQIYALFEKIKSQNTRFRFMAQHADSIKNPEQRKQFIKSIQHDDFKSEAMNNFAETISDTTQRLKYINTIPVEIYRDIGKSNLLSDIENHKQRIQLIESIQDDGIKSDAMVKEAKHFDDVKKRLEYVMLIPKIFERDTGIFEILPHIETHKQRIQLIESIQDDDYKSEAMMEEAKHFDDVTERREYIMLIPEISYRGTAIFEILPHIENHKQRIKLIESIQDDELKSKAMVEEVKHFDNVEKRLEYIILIPSDKYKLKAFENFLKNDVKNFKLRRKFIDKIKDDESKKRALQSLKRDEDKMYILINNYINGNGNGDQIMKKLYEIDIQNIIDFLKTHYGITTNTSYLNIYLTLLKLRFEHTQTKKKQSQQYQQLKKTQKNSQYVLDSIQMQRISIKDYLKRPNTIIVNLPKESTQKWYGFHLNSKEELYDCVDDLAWTQYKQWAKKHSEIKLFYFKGEINICLFQNEIQPLLNQGYNTFYIEEIEKKKVISKEAIQQMDFMSSFHCQTKIPVFQIVHKEKR